MLEYDKTMEDKVLRALISGYDYESYRERIRNFNRLILGIIFVRIRNYIRLGIILGQD